MGLERLQMDLGVQPLGQGSFKHVPLILRRRHAGQGLYRFFEVGGQHDNGALAGDGEIVPGAAVQQQPVPGREAQGLHFVEIGSFLGMVGGARTMMNGSCPRPINNWVMRRWRSGQSTAG